jgi:fatty acyl-CoA reductase
VKEATALEGVSPARLPGAFFDVDGTLASSNLILTFVNFQFWRLSRWRRLAWLFLFLPRIPFYIVLDAVSRRRFNTAFFRNYSGVYQSELEQWAQEAVKGFWQQRLFREGLDRVRQHLAHGHRVVLITGNLKPILDPLGIWLEADKMVGAQPEVAEGCLTGRLVGGTMNGEAKAATAQLTAELLGLDLSASYVYTDSYDDRTLLESVGRPVAVNPDWRLRRLTRRRGWPILHWRHF